MKINLDVLSPKSVEPNPLIVLSGRNLISHSTPPPFDPSSAQLRLRLRLSSPIFIDFQTFAILLLPSVHLGRFLSVRYLSSASSLLSAARFSAALPPSLPRSSPNMLIVIPSISCSPPPPPSPPVSLLFLARRRSDLSHGTESDQIILQDSLGRRRQQRRRSRDG